MKIRPFLVVATLVASSMVTGFASADTASDEARTHFQRGAALYEEQDYRSALAEFSRAYELAPNATVLFNIGQAYYQLNEYANALLTLEKYVAGGDFADHHYRDLATREIAELKTRVQYVAISTDVPDAEISVDDQAIGPSPQKPLLAVGRRRISASKPGYTTVTRLVDVAHGDDRPVVLKLPPVGAAPARSGAEGWPKPLIFGSFGLGAVGVGVGTVFGILAMNDRSELSGRCDANKFCPPELQTTRDDMTRNGTISTIGFVVGAVGVGAGLVFALTPRPRTASQRGSVGLWTSGASGGVGGTF